MYKKLFYYDWRDLKGDWVIKTCVQRRGGKWGPHALEFLLREYRKYLRVVALSLPSRRSLFHRPTGRILYIVGVSVIFIDIGRLSS